MQSLEVSGAVRHIYIYIYIYIYASLGFNGLNTNRNYEGRWCSKSVNFSIYTYFQYILGNT